MTSTPRPHVPGPAPTASEALAEVRFGIPGLSHAHVSRRRLLETLSAADGRPLVVVSGPAGAGKTALVAEWVRQSADDASATGWITFEEGDTAFWPPVVECLQRRGLAMPTVRVGESDALLMGRKNVMAVAAALVESGRRWTLVLDGYELVSLPLARELDFLLRHTLGSLQVVLLGRVDPLLPLYRYRLADDLVEVRGEDLALTDVEAARLLSRLGVTLSAEAIHDLNRRVRGWAAGLVFAARALASAPAPDQAVDTVLHHTGDINEYLVGEVLDVQTPEVRDFLLATSVTEVITPGLVEELNGPGAVHTLATVARANAFIEPVPDEPGAYRYFPFFRDLLRARLAYEAPDADAELHRRAARWFRRTGAVEQSVRHLVEVGAWDELLTGMVDDLTVARLLLEGSTGALRCAVQGMPRELVSREACIIRAAAALAAGDRSSCAVEVAKARESTAADEGDSASLAILVVDAVRASFGDDAAFAATVVAEAARELRARPVAAGTVAARSAAEAEALVEFSRGVAMLRAGELDFAGNALWKAASGEAVLGYPSFRARCLGYTAVAHALNGDLSEACRMAALSLVAAGEGGPAVAGAVAHVALAQVALEQCDRTTARQHLAFVTPPAGIVDDPVCSAVIERVRAGLERMNGEDEAAGARLLAAADSLSLTDPVLARTLRVDAARVAVTMGRPEVALETIEGTSAPTPCAEVVAAEAHAELHQDAVAAGLIALVPELQLPLAARVSKLLVEALLASRSGSPGRVRSLLDRSLRLAAADELRRPFREAGPAIGRLLTTNADLLLRHRWLTDPTAPRAEASSSHDLDNSSTPPSELASVMVETLTPKELEVLGHLEQLLTTDEIAAEMFVSVNTVRTHVRSVLRKLGVNRRNAAVRKARELGLVSA